MDGGRPTVVGMRWERLFADMEAQVAAMHRAELRALAADLVRAERAAVALSDRLRASIGHHLRLRLRGGSLVIGTLVDAAPEWLLLADGPVRRMLVPSAALVAVHGAGGQVAPPAGRVEGRLGLGHALRALARDRVPVSVETSAGSLTGRIERVGADHLDLVDGGQAAGASAWSVPFGAVLAVRSS